MAEKETTDLPTGGSAPQIRFEAISEGWQLFQQKMRAWVITTFLYFLIVVVLISTVSAAFLAHYLLHRNTTLAQNFHSDVLGDFFALFLLTTLNYFLNGGMFRMALKQIQGEPIRLGDLFSARDVLPSLTGYAFITVLAFQIPDIFHGGAVRDVSMLLELIPGGLLMFAVPLMVDRHMGPLEAMAGSFFALRKQALLAVMFYTCTLILGSAGAVVFGIGIVFSYPMMILPVAIIYRDFFLAGPPSNLSPLPDDPPSPEEYAAEPLPFPEESMEEPYSEVQEAHEWESSVDEPAEPVGMR